MPTALEMLAVQSQQRAEKAVGAAKAGLCAPLDAKSAELDGIRAQVAGQTKALAALVASCESRNTKLKKATASSEQSSRAADAQAAVELLNRRIRVVEETERLRAERSTE